MLALTTFKRIFTAIEPIFEGGKQRNGLRSLKALADPLQFDQRPGDRKILIHWRHLEDFHPIKEAPLCDCLVRVKKVRYLALCFGKLINYSCSYLCVFEENNDR